MKATELIRLSLASSKDWTMGLATDMQDAPLTRPTPNGGNHPMWALGHLVYSEGDLTCAMIEGKPNPLAEWKEIFGQGTEPVDDASRYPAYEEVLAKWEEVRGNTLAMLDSLSDEDLDKKSHAPEEMAGFFGTVGQCLSAIAIHTTFHAGQIADARRAAGRKPVMG